MKTLIWWLIGPIFLISVKAQIRDYVPHSFYEKPLSSSPSPPLSQALPPDLIGKKEIVLFLTPDQVEVLQEAGAVVKPYPEYEPEFDKLQQQFEQSTQHQNVDQKIQSYQTASQNRSPKLGSRLDSYYKFLNIQQINDGLVEPSTTEHTRTEITTTSRHKFTKSQQYYKDRQHSAPNTRKTGSVKLSSEKTNSEYMRSLPNYENDSLKIIPYEALPLRPYRFDKNLSKIYPQSNEETDINAQTINEARQNSNIQSNKEIQRNAYNRVHSKHQRKQFSEPNKESQRNVYLVPRNEVSKSAVSTKTKIDGFTQPGKDSQHNEYTQIKEEDQKHTHIKRVNKAQQNRQLNKNFTRRNKQTQVNGEVQRNNYTIIINEGRQRAHNQADDDAGRQSYKIDETQLNSYTKTVDETQPNLKAIEETQRLAYFTPASEELNENVHNDATKGLQHNVYTIESKNIRHSANIKPIEKVKPAQLTIDDLSKNLRTIVEIPISKFKQNPLTVPSNLGVEDTKGYKANFNHFEDLQSSLNQKKKQGTPVSPDNLFLLLAPLYQHNAITDIIAQQREELLSGELKIHARLQELKHAPHHDHQEYTSQLEKLTSNLGKQNALAEIEFISKSPAVVNQESNIRKIRPTEHEKNNFSVLSSELVRVQGPIEVKIPDDYPAPLQFIRPIPVPVLQTQNNEAEKFKFPVNWNVNAKEEKTHVEQKFVPVTIGHKLPFDPVAIPEHVTILRPIWEH